MARHALAIDLGTTSVKVAVVAADGTVRSSAAETLRLLVADDGGAEQDPNSWWDAIGRCARRAVAESGLERVGVTVVAVTSQYTSTVPVAADGTAVGNAIMWMDRRGRRYSRAQRDADVRPRWVEVHGMAPGGNDDIGHVDFLRAERPDVYAAAHAFVEPMDHIVARLTGRVTATQNTAFPMLSVDNRVWGRTEYSEELLAMSGLDVAKLPLLVPLGQPRGPILAAGADHLGVSPSAMVMDATIDSVTSAVGTGAIRSDTCGLILGTTSVMATHLPSKRHDVGHGLTAAPSPLTDRWLLVAENGAGGKGLEVFVTNMVFAPDGLGRPFGPGAFDEVLDAAANVAAGSNGVLFLPWLVGSMAPAWNPRARGGFINIGLSTTRSDMARAVLEGVAMNAAWLLPYFSTLAERRYTEVSLGGGGAASALWGQIVADSLGVRIRRLADPRTTNAHGAALLALSQAGEFQVDELPSLLHVQQEHEPDEANHRLMARLTTALIDYHERTATFHGLLETKDLMS